MTLSETPLVAKVPDSLASLIGGIAFAMRQEKISSGDMAALRRLQHDDPGSPAFWRILAIYIEPSGLMSPYGSTHDEAERQWAVILNGLAIVQGYHDRDRRFGEALAAAGLSELRFARLLRARGATLDDAIRTLASILANKAIPANWVEIARLLRHQDDDQAEACRRHVARDYYRALHRINS